MPFTITDPASGSTTPLVSLDFNSDQRVAAGLSTADWDHTGTTVKPNKVNAAGGGDIVAGLKNFLAVARIKSGITSSLHYIGFQWKVGTNTLLITMQGNAGLDFVRDGGSHVTPITNSFVPSANTFYWHMIHKLGNLIAYSIWTTDPRVSSAVPVGWAMSGLTGTDDDDYGNGQTGSLQIGIFNPSDFTVEIDELAVYSVGAHAINP